MAYIQFLGAAGTVTGSKHLVNLSADASGKAGLQVLIDCGIFQGQKEWRDRNWEPAPIPPAAIEAVILTHAHLDHCGWLPRLLKEGFRGPIYATPPTIDLCGVVLPDSGHLQEEDAAFHNKHKTSKHTPALPLYTMQDAQDCMQFFKPTNFGEVIQVGAGLSFRFSHSAHILGSALVEISAQLKDSARALLFTGDVGRVSDTTLAPGKVIHRGPTQGESADLVVMESTYGNRLHPTTDPRPEMAELIKKTLERGGCVVIPSFAVERTQKVLFMLKNLMETGQIPRVPVHSDSPMAAKAVQIYMKYEQEFTDDARELISKYGSPLAWPNFFFDTDVEASKKLNDSRFPMIIVSSSGMASGGRIQHHLLLRLPDSKNLVLFIGFQAPGTPGFIIKSGASTVRLLGQEIAIRAHVAALEQFSDHADTPELLEWLRTFKKAPRVTYLVHGEPAAASQLRLAMTSALGWKVEIAQWMQKVELK